MDATSDNDADIAGLSIEISAISVKSLNPEVITDGNTRAYIGGHATVSAAGITADATSTNDPTLVSVGFIVSAIGIDVNNTKLETKHDTEAFVSRDADFSLQSGARRRPRGDLDEHGPARQRLVRPRRDRRQRHAAGGRSPAARRARSSTRARR